MSFCIYKVVNTVNGLLYVGRTENLYKRWLKHKNEAKHGSSRPLHRAIQEYGADCFYPEIIEECSEYAIAKSRETYWIRMLNTVRPHGYNAEAPKLSDTEAAIVRYNAWGWTFDQYASYFGMSVTSLKSLRYGWSHFHVTREYLPGR